jgi:hypothetical protein
MGWFHLPLSILRAYTTMLPRLVAEDNLNRASVALVSSGNLKPQDAQRQIRTWKRQREGQTAVVKLSEPDKIAVMRGVGISVE